MVSTQTEYWSVPQITSVESLKKTMQLDNIPKKRTKYNREVEQLGIRLEEGNGITSYKIHGNDYGVNKRITFSKQRCQKWVFKEFTNPARTDGLALKHWIKESQFKKNEPYVFAKLDKHVNIPTYTDIEYTRHLHEQKWTRQETDHLFDLCRRFDLKWYIIHDRWEIFKNGDDKKKTKSLVDMKARYYNVLNWLNAARDLNVPPIRYDDDHEKKRKKQLTLLMNRTKEQIEEEEELLMELKKIEARKRERERRAQDLQKLIRSNESNPNSPAINSAALSPLATMPKKKIQTKNSIATTNRTIATTPKILPQIPPVSFDFPSIRWPEFKGVGVHARSAEQKLPSSIGTKKTANIDKIFLHLKLPYVVDSHEDLVSQYNQFRDEITQLHELKSLLLSSEASLQTLSQQFENEGLPPLNIESRFRASTAVELGIDDYYNVFGIPNDPNEVIKLGYPNSSRKLMGLLDVVAITSSHARKRKSTIPQGFMANEMKRITKDMSSNGEYAVAYASGDTLKNDDCSSSSKVDTTLPLPTYHVNSSAVRSNKTTPRSRGNITRPYNEESSRPKNVNSCLFCLGSIWDLIIETAGRYSLLSIVLSILGILLLVSCIPFTIIILTQSNNPKETEILQTKDISARSMHFYETFLPPAIGVCPEYGFNCNNDPNEYIGITQRCDGIIHCTDGSDEENCHGCHSGFSCPSKLDPNVVICLRGNKLCDGIKHCDDGSDEELFCNRRNCTENEFYCESNNSCIKKEYQCDGDPHCPGEEDEVECSSCNNGAVLCPSTKKCIPSWNICDGTAQCTDKFDEENCSCNKCSGNNRVMCKKSGFCTTKDRVCDGNIDCPYGEDEEGCPGTCSINERNSTSKSHLVQALTMNDFVKCNDGKNYIRNYACSGLLRQCDGVCDNGCDTELSFTCKNGACISRSDRCNGVSDCVDGSDEDNCGCDDDTQYKCASDLNSGLSKCIDKNLLCDGVRDCPQGDDEVNCKECRNPHAIYCPSTSTCYPSIARCDGISHCPDNSDEMECSCEECSVHPYNMYICSTSKRCFRKESACTPYPICPSPSEDDVNYCLSLLATKTSIFGRNF
uniref:DNA methyltransferase 1-associated protein 1 n=1 Tax=Strongyloides stercoralis TaxID=6248 RepID=A0AAF5DGG6_STRER